MKRNPRCNYVSRREVRFKEVWVDGLYRVMLPEFMLEDSYSGGPDCYKFYEIEHLASMKSNLKKGDVLFDIGAESGWPSAIYAGFVGAENMCLFEPSEIQWPRIRLLWEGNNLLRPCRTFCGFIADTTALNPRFPCAEAGEREGWPLAAWSDDIQIETEFRSVIERGYGRDIPQITVDDFVAKTGTVPRALTVDVEGAEALVVKGARGTLGRYHPLVWLSLHIQPPPHLSGKDQFAKLENHTQGALLEAYHSSREEIMQPMESLGYKGEYLGFDGDECWFFRPI